MSDDFEDKPRGKKKKGSGDNTVKTVLIIFGGFFGLVLLVCCGVGGYLTYAVKSAAERAAMTKPADIQKLTAEMTDITIPPEFTPQFGSVIPIINIKMVHYGWCPTGNCPAVTDISNIDHDNVLSLTSVDLKDSNGTAIGNPDSEDSSMSDDVLKSQWKEYAKTEHTFDIRGKSCKFYIVQGEEFASAAIDFDDSDEEMPFQPEPAAASDDAAEESDEDPAAGNPSETKPASSRAGTGKKMVQISGNFPGKKAEVTLQIRVKAEDYNEAKILEMLKSIK